MSYTKTLSVLQPKFESVTRNRPPALFRIGADKKSWVRFKIKEGVL